jgi:hypothetical protein
MYRAIPGLAALALAAAASTAAAAQLTVTVQNLAAPDSISFAPLHFGVHAGAFDAFDNGEAADAAIVSVAEGGAGGAWQAAFAAAEPAAARGTVGGLLLPGLSRSLRIDADAPANPYFTFATMVVPSNDFFIGNDSPTAYRIFDASGKLLLTRIDQLAGAIWDAGSELFDPAAAAFAGDNDLRTPQNGVVSRNFAEPEGFDGLPTGAGYIFHRGLAADSAVYRISFSVPEPSTLSLATLAVLGFAASGLASRRLEAGSVAV